MVEDLITRTEVQVFPKERFSLDPKVIKIQ